MTSAATTQSIETCCIVLVPLGRAHDELSRTLSDAMASHGFEMRSPDGGGGAGRLIMAQSPLAAMAELAVRERIYAARSAWGLPRAGRLALVVLEPASATAAAMVRSVRRYLPTVTILVTQNGELLQPYQSPGKTAPAAKPERIEAHNEDMSGAGRRDDPVRSDGGGNTPTAVTREELDMLLGAEMGLDVRND